MATVMTIGHSTRSIEELLGLLTTHSVEHVVDVRRYPGSRRYPHFGQEALAASLAERGIGYTHAPDLGGRRSASKTSPHTAWRSAAFRGYADYMDTEPFQEAFARLVALADGKRVAILCSEAVPWRCHRQLIADALVARGHEALHIVSEKPASKHVLNPHARVLPDGRVSYAKDESSAGEEQGELDLSGE